MNGGTKRFDLFCEVLIATGQHDIVNRILKPQPTVPSNDQSDAESAVVQTITVESQTTPVPTCRQDEFLFLSADCLRNLRKHWNDLYGDIRSDSEFLSELVSREVFTDMQIKKLRVCEHC